MQLDTAHCIIQRGSLNNVGILHEATTVLQIDIANTQLSRLKPSLQPAVIPKHKKAQLHVYAVGLFLF